ncbi:MAG: PaaI family thioesterase [Actinomycetota bacterium]
MIESDGRTGGSSPLDIPPSRSEAFESDHPRVVLAEGLRGILQHSSTSTASDDVFARAAEHVARAAELLANGPHGRPYDGSSEGAVGGVHHGFLSHSPVTGPLNALASRVHLETTDREVSATVTYGDAYEGPPGCLHGGFIAAIFDEVLGLAQALSGAPGMTGRLVVTYRSPTPLHTELRVVGRLDSVEGRKILTSGEIRDGDRLCAEAVGTFISVRPGTFSSLDVNRRRGGE